MREQGFAVESVCAVLREQSCQIAVRSYRARKAGRPPAARIHGDAVVIDALLATVGQLESLYGRRMGAGGCAHTPAGAAATLGQEWEAA